MTILKIYTPTHENQFLILRMSLHMIDFCGKGNDDKILGMVMEICIQLLCKYLLNIGVKKNLEFHIIAHYNGRDWGHRKFRKVVIVNG